MAQRYGSKYSPPGATTGPKEAAEAPVDDRIVDAAGAKATILFVPAVVLVAFSFGSGPVTLVIALIAAAILTLAAWLLRDGLRATAAYDARSIARRPALPRKMLASALTGIGVALAAFTGDSGIIGAVLYGAAALGLHVAAFGIDPLKDKRMEGVDPYQQDRVARVVDEAEDYLAATTTHAASLNDRALDARVAAFTAAARKMIRTVEEDPRDLTEARRYLGVYLMGARDATVKFVDVTKRNPNPQARIDYEALLTDLEQNFASRTAKMLEGGKADMDIEIKVLRDRLQREGV
jgi:5-bromo-4-chloroindolyl phosphate hydrolysis protein